MSTDQPASQVIGEVQDLLAEFCQQCLEWERDWESLLDELGQLEIRPTETSVDRQANANDSSNLNELQRKVNENSELHARQESISQDLADLKKLVLEQTAAFSEMAGGKE